MRAFGSIPVTGISGRQRIDTYPFLAAMIVSEFVQHAPDDTILHSVFRDSFYTHIVRID